MPWNGRVVVQDRFYCGRSRTLESRLHGRVAVRLRDRLDGRVATALL